MDLTIREATRQDYEAVCALVAQVDQIHIEALPDIFRPAAGPAREREYMEEIIIADDARLFVAEHDGMVIGLTQAKIRDASGWPFAVARQWINIDEIVVDERFRGMGIGRALLARVEEWAHSQGIGRIELNVWEFNASARSLYESEGFRTLKRTMCKDLDR